MTSAPKTYPLWRERREFSRVEGSWPATILTDQGAIEGKAKNVSLRSALIRLRDLPGLIGNLDLAIEFPEHHYAIMATAEIVRMEVNDAEDGTLYYRLGVRFLEIPEEDVQLLASTVLH